MYIHTQTALAKPLGVTLLTICMYQYYNTVETLSNECSGTQANDHCREWVRFSEVILTYLNNKINWFLYSLLRVNPLLGVFVQGVSTVIA